MATKEYKFVELAYYERRNLAKVLSVLKDEFQIPETSVRVEQSRFSQSGVRILVSTEYVLPGEEPYYAGYIDAALKFGLK